MADVLRILLAVAVELHGFPGSSPVAGVLRERGLPRAGFPSSPEVIARALRGAGFEARFLSAADLADPAVLRPDKLALVVLPYGRSFPAAARETWISYLRGGGDFISTGGYAFQNLLVKEGELWVGEKEVLDRRLVEALKVSLLFDGGFEHPASRTAPVGGEDMEARWHRTSDACRVVAKLPGERQRCARVFAADVEQGCEWYLNLPVTAGRVYRVSALSRTEEVKGAGYAYLAVYQYDAARAFIRHHDFAMVRGTSPWTRRQLEFTPAPGAARISLKAGLYRASGTAWFDDFRLADVSEAQPRPMNTATGIPRDGLEVKPSQIGIFDADYRLKRVARVAGAAGQKIFPEGIAFGPISGWAASGVRGNDGSRWIPLLESFDRYGRPRGIVGSLMLNYSGYYTGSSWAYFGAENIDIFDARNHAALSALGKLARFMVREVYLRNLESEYAAYRPGEGAVLRVSVENRGEEDRDTVVELRVEAGDGGEPVAIRRRSVRVAAKASAQMEEKLEVPRSAGGLVRFTATLSVVGEPAEEREDATVGEIGKSDEIDELTAAFVVLQPLESSGGAPLSFRDNYLCYGDRPLFLFGSDNYSNVYVSAAQGPLWWAREHAASRDFGFEIYENLQYSNPGHVLREIDWRRFHGMAQLTQEYGLTFMPGLLIGHNVAVSDEEIAAQSRQCREYAARLKGVPKLLWYINGDYQLRYDDPDGLKKKWNLFLQETYGDSEKLKAAWGPEAPQAEIGQLAFPPPNSGKWESGRQVDLQRFHVKLMSDWNRAHVTAIRIEDREHAITSEYYSFPFSGIDLRLSLGGQDISNFGYFDEPVKDIEYLPLKIRWNDLRARGRSVGLGEYGVKTHPAWSAGNGAFGYHIARTEEEQKELFLAIAHYAFGMGCSRVQNWCLRDSDERVFPWGVFYPGPPVPKDVAFVHRNLSLCFRLLEPRYEPPALTVLICVHLRLGNSPELGLESAYRAFRVLLGLHVDFNVLGDSFANRIPQATRALIYPAALCAGDDSFAALVRWVRSGGTLLMTGGTVYDATRRLVRPGRLAELAGVKWAGLRYAVTDRASQAMTPLRTAPGSKLPPLAAAPFARVKALGAAVLATDEGGAPVLTRHELGRGVVYFLADPLELLPKDDGSLGRLYGWFLGEARIPRLPVIPEDPRIHLFAQRTRSGRVYTAFNTRRGGSFLDTRLGNGVGSGAGEVTLRVRDRHPALAAVGDDGNVTIVGAYQSARLGKHEFLSADGLITVAALDGEDVRTSSALMLLPFSAGDVRLSPTRRWQNPTVLLGDLHGGKFRVLEKVPQASVPPGGSSALAVSLDVDRATLIGLIAEEATVARWQEFLGTLTSTPEKVRGR